MAKPKQTKVEKQENEVRKLILEELFYDFNRSRAKIYKLNFMRGIFFGFGSALGGTAVLALVIWLLALLGEAIPALGDFFKMINDALQNAASGE